jgi:hypothetical protein
VTNILEELEAGAGEEWKKDSGGVGNQNQRSINKIKEELAWRRWGVDKDWKEVGNKELNNQRGVATRGSGVDKDARGGGGGEGGGWVTYKELRGVCD